MSRCWSSDGVDLASPTAFFMFDYVGEALFFAHVRLFAYVRSCVGSNPVAYPACVYDDRLPHGARWVVVLFI